jgi:hypothetical protein
LRAVGDCGTIITRVAQGIGITVRLVGVVGIDTVIATIADRVSIVIEAARRRRTSVAVVATLNGTRCITPITASVTAIIAALSGINRSITTRLRIRRVRIHKHTKKNTQHEHKPLDEKRRSVRSELVMCSGYYASLIIIRVREKFFLMFFSRDDARYHCTVANFEFALCFFVVGYYTVRD